MINLLQYVSMFTLCLTCETGVSQWQIYGQKTKETGRRRTRKHRNPDPAGGILHADQSLCAGLPEAVGPACLCAGDDPGRQLACSGKLHCRLAPPTTNCPLSVDHISWSGPKGRERAECIWNTPAVFLIFGTENILSSYGCRTEILFFLKKTLYPKEANVE